MQTPIGLALILAAMGSIFWANIVQLGQHAFSPLGLQEKPHVTCTPIDAATCRVQYG